ncbi:MAG: flagellar biosynthesis protein FlhB [Chloroflexota bacterium]|jgi:flagellar biosynthetic protein FlhB|nr:flagellar biosynthesis protein FlhB [Chloroflexota bacterium]
MPAGERTEAPTQRHLEEMRSQGRVVRSAELSSAVALVVGFGILQAFGTAAATQLNWYLQHSLSSMSRDELSPEQIAQLAFGAGAVLLTVLAPMLLLMPVVGTLISLAQSGFVLSGRGLKPDVDRINPLSGTKRLFSLQSTVALARTVAKAGLLTFIIGHALFDSMGELMGLASTDVRVAAPQFAGIITRLGLTAGCALLVLGIADYAYQRWEYMRSARMTKQEIKEEQRQTEGAPELRARIRQLQRRFANGRMLQRVATADVVITNPTHFAVALSYRGGEMRAPTVVAKGADLIAARIRALANANDVPIVENRPLAQALYRSVDLGREIPEALFEAVAQVLAYVYSLPGRAPLRRASRG